MGKGIGCGVGRGRLGHGRLFAHGQAQQRLLRFLRQMRQQVEQRGLGGLAHVVHPFLGHAEAHEFQLAQPGKQLWPRGGLGRGTWRSCGGLRGKLLDPFPHLHQLHGAGCRVALDLAALGPAIGLVVMVHIGQQQTGGAAMHDQPDIRIRPHRPEIPVHRTVQLVEGQAGCGGVHLQIEGGGLHGLLLLRCQAPEAVCEGVGDAELHQDTANTFITSSPR